MRHTPSRGDSQKVLEPRRQESESILDKKRVGDRSGRNGPGSERVPQSVCGRRVTLDVEYLSYTHNLRLRVRTEVVNYRFTEVIRSRG